MRNIAFWVRKLFDYTQTTVETLSSTQDVRLTRVLYTVDTSGGSVTLTLPPAKDAKGEWVHFKKMTAANMMTIIGSGSETIDGSVSVSTSTQYDSYTLYSSGTEWFIA